jgi:hypothetical protein
VVLDVAARFIGFLRLALRGLSLRNLVSTLAVGPRHFHRFFQALLRRTVIQTAVVREGCTISPGWTCVCGRSIPSRERRRAGTPLLWNLGSRLNTRNPNILAGLLHVFACGGVS